jgi:Fur family transcriptional regulator, ferric uptake regulator
MTTSVRRPTRQRAAVTQLLGQVEGFHSAQELHAMLRDRGEQVGLATVYRALQALAEDGEVDVLRHDEGEAVYRRCGTTRHHHHLVCRSCGRTVELDDETVEAWARDVAGRHGFVAVDHVVEIVGTCSACAAVTTAQAAPR